MHATIIIFSSELIGVTPLIYRQGNSQEGVGVGQREMYKVYQNFTASACMICPLEGKEVEHPELKMPRQPEVQFRGPPLTLEMVAV